MDVYMDTSALNLLFDDRAQIRIALEAKANDLYLITELARSSRDSSGGNYHSCRTNGHRQNLDIFRRNILEIN